MLLNLLPTIDVYSRLLNHWRPSRCITSSIPCWRTPIFLSPDLIIKVVNTPWSHYDYSHPENCNSFATHHVYFHFDLPSLPVIISDDTLVLKVILLEESSCAFLLRPSLTSSHHIWWYPGTEGYAPCGALILLDILSLTVIHMMILQYWSSHSHGTTVNNMFQMCDINYKYVATTCQKFILQHP